MEVKLRRLCKALLFVAVLAATLAGLQHFFLVGPFSSSERVGRDNHVSFRAQGSNTLDVVYVGASNVYSFWQAPLAWDSYGLASQSYANWSMPPAAIRYIIQECRKTQPNALYVVNINNFRDEGTSKVKHCHWSIDDLPLSVDKIRLVQELCEQNGYDLDEAIELLFPLLSFHSTWSDLQSEDFAPQYADVGGAATNPRHFSTVDVSDEFETYKKKKDNLSDYGPFDEEGSKHESLDDLIDYCKREEVSILFVLQPQALTDAETLYRLDELRGIVEDEGMDIVDMSDPDTSGLDPYTDFWNSQHTNSHGSIKYTNYLAKYITDNYVIPDRRGDEHYEGWDDTADRYKTYLMTHNIRDFEFDVPSYRTTLRSYNPVAKNMHLYVRFTWEPAEEADEYLVYRQHVGNIENPSSVDDLNEYAWECIATLPGDATSYNDYDTYESKPLASLGMSTSGDTELSKEQYDYVAIPILHNDGETVYGSYYTARASVELLQPVAKGGAR